MSIDAKRHREVGDEIIRLVGLKGQNWRKVVITLESPSPRIGVVMEAWAEVPPAPVLPTFDEWVEAYGYEHHYGWVYRRSDFADDFSYDTRGNVPDDVFDVMQGADVQDADVSRRKRHYANEKHVAAALRDALLRLGKIRE